MRLRSAKDCNARRRRRKKKMKKEKRKFITAFTTARRLSLS
jgi:hypothetical protein